MPWTSIIVWLISFLVSKSSGASNGKAALIATGAGLASYYTIDPANKDNILGVTFGDSKTVPGNPTVTSGSNGAVDGLASIGKTVVSTAGDTLKSWGPTGTLAVVAGTQATSSIDWEKYFPWILGGFGLWLLTSRR